MNSYIILLVFTCLLLTACNPTPLETALRLAGPNRPELEKVLTHYSQNPEDSLKLKAAIFLIENMPGHNSYSSPEMAKFYEEIRPILDLNLDSRTVRDSVEKVSAKYTQFQLDMSEDIEIIRADYLIRNIDLAFETWQAKVWLKDVTFDNFCEYVLPYKCAETQQLDYWRDTLSTMFTRKAETALYDDRDHLIISRFAGLVNKDIGENTSIPFIYPDNDIAFLSASTVHKTRYGTCDNTTHLVVSVMRSHGIPAAIDFTPQWPNGPAGHTWYTVFNNDTRPMHFPWVIKSNPGDQVKIHSPLSKVYRKTYSKNEEIQAILDKTDTPLLTSYIFHQDVTDEYRPTSDVSVPVFTSANRHKVAYLANFDRRTDFTLVGVGEIKRGHAKFRKLGRGVVYLIVTYDGQNLEPAAYPFILDYQGRIHTLTPDLSTLENIGLRRKYFKTENTRRMEERVMGGKIEASDHRDFFDFVTLYEIGDLDYPDKISTRTERPYRYWRFRARSSTYCNIAELEFYKRGEGDSIARGGIIGSGDPWDETYDHDKAFDNDWLTHFHTRLPKGGWVGMDFGEPVFIDHVRCVQRSDDNSIHYGETYELKYWGQTGWVSLGLQEARDKVLYFDGVPGNSLLLLQNHTKGKDERIFTWTDDRQKFW